MHYFDTFMFLIVVTACFFAFIIGALGLAHLLYNRYVKKKFFTQFSIAVPKHITIKTTKHFPNSNKYVLSYPHWQHPKKDKTRDRRISNNNVIQNESTLYLENYILKSKSPMSIVNFVEKLRNKGIEIDVCKEERKKIDTIQKRLHILESSNSAQSIKAEFEDNPSGFETFCANLFEKMGYKARVTPPTNDGGFDIKLFLDNETCLVECKCFAKNSKISRPAIQKLVGANQKENADRMIFITTSDFAKPAVDFAHQTHVELINGDKLVNLCKEYLMIEGSSASVNTQNIKLTRKDLEQYVAKDLYNYL